MGRTRLPLFALLALVLAGALWLLAGRGGQVPSLMFAAPLGDPANEPRWTGPLPAPLRTFFVDFARGKDTASGTSREQAWKHAPGDPEATGTPAAFVPRPGDRILLAANTRYFGSIVAGWQGSAGQPIVIEGEGSGGTAIIDGSSQSAMPQPCASQAMCAGIPGWRGLAVARFARPLAPGAALAQGGALLPMVQWPNPADPFYADEVADFADATGSELNAGMAPLPKDIAAALTDPAGLRIAIWTLHNSIVERPVISVAKGGLRFDPGEARTYTDRPSHFALRGHPALIDRVGEYAVLPDRRTVVLKPATGGGPVFVSDGRSGIDLADARYLVVRGLGFENFADVPRNVRSGVPILSMRAGAGHIRIEGNRFANITLRQSMGAITIWDSADIAITGNSITTVAYGSGMRLLRNKGLTVEGNDISRLGRTGVMLMDNLDSLVAGNRIHDIMGVHGNGLSAYLGNRRTRVVGNSIWAAKQPATFHGNGAKQPVADDILFARNLFVAPEDSLGALISWGRAGKGIRLIGNVILGGGKGALRLNKADDDIMVEGNVLDGLIFGSAFPPGWTVRGNAFRKLGVLQARYQPNDRASLPFAAVREGAMPSGLAAFCPRLSTAEGIPVRYRAAIGADFTCP